MTQVTVESGQSIVDIAVQELGSSEGLKVICDLNNLEYDDDLYPGQVLILPDRDLNNAIQSYFKSKNIMVNSHIDESLVEVLGTNDDQPITTNINEGIGV